MERKEIMEEVQRLIDNLGFIMRDFENYQKINPKIDKHLVNAFDELREVKALLGGYE